MKPSSQSARCLLLCLVGAFAAACAGEVPADIEALETEAGALRAKDPEGAADPGPAELPDPIVSAPDPDAPDRPRPPPPPPPPLPRPQGKVVRVSSAALDSMMVTLLTGSRLVVDTTKKSPTIPNGEQVYICHYPNAEARAAEQAECMRMAGAARAQCLRMMNETFPNIKTCQWVAKTTHSYLDFGPLAESHGAVDVPFNNIQTIERDTRGPGGIEVDIHNVRTTVGYGTTRAYFTRRFPHVANAVVRLELSSNNPTLPCRHTTPGLGCPDIELREMVVFASLSGIGPSEDGTELDFVAPEAVFTFRRNLNNIPDWLLTTFVDVDSIIRNNVERNVEKALGTDRARTVLRKAMTGIATVAARNQIPGWQGWKKIHAAWYDRGDLVIDHDPL